MTRWAGILGLAIATTAGADYSLGCYRQCLLKACHEPCLPSQPQDVCDTCVNAHDQACENRCAEKPAEAQDVDDVCYGCCHLRMCRDVCGKLDKSCEPCLRECLERAKVPDCRAKECGEKPPPNPSMGLAVCDGVDRMSE